MRKLSGVRPASRSNLQESENISAAHRVRYLCAVEIGSPEKEVPMNRPRSHLYWAIAMMVMAVFDVLARTWMLWPVIMAVGAGIEFSRYLRSASPKS